MPRPIEWLNKPLQGCNELINTLLQTLLRLKDNFFDSTIYEAQMEAIIKGMLKQRAESFDANVVSDVTEDLFANVDFPGSDLIARNIHRGRDHGLPGYNEYRKGTLLEKSPDIPANHLHCYIFALQGNMWHAKGLLLELLASRDPDTFVGEVFHHVWLTKRHWPIFCRPGWNTT